MSKTDRKTPDRPRDVSTEPTDPKLALWIQKLWSGGEEPQSIHVVQSYKGGKVFGRIVHTENIKANAPMDAAKATEYANTFLEAAQLDCDKIVHKKQSYLVLSYDKAKGAEAYRSYPLALTPKTTYLVTKDEDGNFPSGESGADDEDGEMPVNSQTLMLHYTKEQIGALQFDKGHYATCFGDMFLLMKGVIVDLADANHKAAEANQKLFTEVITAKRQEEDARNAALDRELARKREEFKLDLWREGIRTGRNVLQMFFGDVKGELTAGEGGPQSEERVAVADFLRDCEAVGIFNKLFGVWNEKGVVTEGIFTPIQCATLVKIRDGQLPAEALDDLLPGSSSAIAITPKQIAAAQPLMPESVGLSLMRIKSIRDRKRAAAQAAAQAAQPQPQIQPAAPIPTTAKE